MGAISSASIPGEGGKSSGDCRDEGESLCRCAPAGAADEEQGSSRANLFLSAARELDWQQEVRLNTAASLLKIEVCEGSVVRAGSGN